MCYLHKNSNIFFLSYAKITGLTPFWPEKTPIFERKRLFFPFFHRQQSTNPLLRLTRNDGKP